MLIEQLISPTVPTLLPTDTGDKALHLMEHSNFSQLPLVAEDEYMALIRENDILDLEKTDTPLSLSEFLNYKPAVYANGHPYDAIRIASDQNLSIVPVLDNDNKYVGAITRNDLLKYITENSGLDLPGGILVLEVAPRDYTLYEIARICENEDVMIISTQVHKMKDTGMLEVTVKTDHTNLQSIAASLERHNYKVKEIYGQPAQDDDTDDRYQQLMNYLNM